MVEEQEEEIKEKEAEEIEKTAFNLAVATLQRIQRLLDDAIIYSQNSLTTPEWFYSLEGVVMTIHSKLSEEELNELDRMEKDIERLKKEKPYPFAVLKAWDRSDKEDKRGLIRRKIRAYSNRIHDLLDKYGMLIPTMEDIGHIFGKRK